MLLQRLDYIFAKINDEAIPSTDLKPQEIELMDISFSGNGLTDSSVSQFSELIRKYDSFRTVNMSNLEVKEGGFTDLADALQYNRTLMSLDLRQNVLKDSTISTLLKCLSDNFVLCEVQLDMFKKRIPKNFDSYPLLSMYEFSFA